VSGSASSAGAATASPSSSQAGRVSLDGVAGLWVLMWIGFFTFCQGRRWTGSGSMRWGGSRDSDI
jgi:hypothetical protein